MAPPLLWSAHMLKWFLFSFALTACATDDSEVIDIDVDVDDGELLDDPAQPSISSDGEDVETLAACSVTINQRSELMITDLAVVEDPVRTKWTGSLATASDGAWHFGRLMTEMAGANDPETFVRTWLQQWAAARTVNGQVVPARPISQVLNAWPKLASGKLDLTKPPLRLLAIVNRFDLRAPGNAGEGRFVFGVLDGAGNQQQFTVILEYKLPAADAAAVATWAADWHALGALARGSVAYRNKLQTITRKFARRNASPSRPNGSAISQVRTNEIALASPWELREFHLTTTGQLRMATLAQTPANGFDGTQVLASYMTANAAAIKAQNHVVPATFQNQPFAAPNIFNNIDFWNAPGITDNTLRFRFSLNTCNGCHGAETQTFFLHVSPRDVGQEAQLSGFLTGETVQDPVVPTTTRTLDDLQRRANGLRAFLCTP